jgi:hypothetical protein
MCVTTEIMKNSLKSVTAVTMNQEELIIFVDFLDWLFNTLFVYSSKRRLNCICLTTNHTSFNLFYGNVIISIQLISLKS